MMFLDLQAYDTMLKGKETDKIEQMSTTSLLTKLVWAAVSSKPDTEARDLSVVDTSTCAVKVGRAMEQTFLVVTSTTFVSVAIGGCGYSWLSIKGHAKVP